MFINKIDLNFQKHSNYKFQKQLFISKAQVLIVKGSAGAGKSYSVSDKLAVLTAKWDMQEGIPLKILVVRKTLPSLKRSCMEYIEKRFNYWNVPYKLNRQDFTASIGNKSQIVYVSMNNPVDYEKVKSITDLDFIWIEEATELSANAYAILKTRLRGGKGKYSQIILTFNPINTTNWIYDFFFVNNYDNAEKLTYTVDNNKYITKEYVKILDDLQYQNINLYKTYRLGQWGEIEGTIFESWKVIEKPPTDCKIIFYGLDFGYSVDPSACIRIYQLSPRDFIIQECFYETKLTNEMLACKFRENKIKPYDEIYADSSEPKSIDEIKRYNFNVLPATKGPGSIQAGIDFLQSLNIFITSDSNNILKERQSYVWKKDKDGKTIPEPVDYMNHALDAIRYAIYTKHYERKAAPIFSPVKEQQYAEKRSNDVYGGYEF